MLSRPQKNLPYRKYFLLATEGSITEPEYFDQFRQFHSIAYARRSGGNSPAKLLSALRECMDKSSLRSGDQVWLVLDRDEWDEEDLNTCSEWVANQSTNSKIKVGLALSNPKFEFWLLLHFEDGDGYTSRGACVQGLKCYIPNYDKHIKGYDWVGMAPQAIDRAMKKLDDSPWPQQNGRSTVALLVKELLAL